MTFDRSSKYSETDQLGAIPPRPDDQIRKAQLNTADLLLDVGSEGDLRDMLEALGLRRCTKWCHASTAPGS